MQAVNSKGEPIGPTTSALEAVVERTVSTASEGQQQQRSATETPPRKVSGGGGHGEGNRAKVEIDNESTAPAAVKAKEAEGFNSEGNVDEDDPVVELVNEVDK